MFKKSFYFLNKLKSARGIAGGFFSLRRSAWKDSGGRFPVFYWNDFAEGGNTTEAANQFAKERKFWK